MNSLDVALRLRTPVRRCAPDADEVVAIRQVSGGASQEIWSFDATTPAGPVPLILRCARRWSVEAQAGCAGMGAEAAMLIAAREGGVPVPDVRYVLKPDDGLGEQARFNARIACNLLQIVQREIEQAPAAQAAELARLRLLLDRTDSELPELNAELCARISDGKSALPTEGLLDHLWATTLDKLAVDQPDYSSYRRAREL